MTIQPVTDVSLSCGFTPYRQAWYGFRHFSMKLTAACAERLNRALQ
jgi:hypothetical protein